MPSRRRDLSSGSSEARSSDSDAFSDSRSTDEEKRGRRRTRTRRGRQESSDSEADDDERGLIGDSDSEEAVQKGNRCLGSKWLVMGGGVAVILLVGAGLWYYFDHRQTSSTTVASTVSSAAESTTAAAISASPVNPSSMNSPLQTPSPTSTPSATPSVTSTASPFPPASAGKSAGPSQAPQPASSSQAATVTGSANDPDCTRPGMSKADMSAVTSFKGVNTNSMLSWFRANNQHDFTNGHSWCWFPYDDNVPGFAPALTAMSKDFASLDFNTQNQKAGAIYCGLEAIIKTPDGKTATLYVADSFNSDWVKSPNNLDIMVGSYPLLLGRNTTNKMDVIMNAQWEFTGCRNDKYKFSGTGSGQPGPDTTNASNEWG